MTDDEKRAYNRAYYLKHREKIKARVKKYAQENAAAVADYQRVYRILNADGRKQYMAQRGSLTKKQNAAWYKKNAEAKRTYSRRWSAAHREHKRERMREYMREYMKRPDVAERNRVYQQVRELNKRAAKGKATVEQIEARAALYGFRCAYCGAENADTIDHVIPVARGGTNWPANLRPACRSCNSSKRDRPLADFLAERK